MMGNHRLMGSRAALPHRFCLYVEGRRDNLLCKTGIARKAAYIFRSNLP